MRYHNPNNPTFFDLLDAVVREDKGICDKIVASVLFPEDDKEIYEYWLSTRANWQRTEE